MLQHQQLHKVGEKMDTRERAEKRQELVASGYAWDMIDNWQAKTDLYWHIDKKNATGGIGFKKAQ